MLPCKERRRWGKKSSNVHANNSTRKNGKKKDFLFCNRRIALRAADKAPSWYVVCHTMLVNNRTRERYWMHWWKVPNAFLNRWFLPGIVLFLSLLYCDVSHWISRIEEECRIAVFDVVAVLSHWSIRWRTMTHDSSALHPPLRSSLTTTISVLCIPVSRFDASPLSAVLTDSFLQWFGTLHIDDFTSGGLNGLKTMELSMRLSVR